MAESSTTTDSLVPIRDGDLAKREALKQEILALIRPYGLDESEPLFSVTEMATMALICSNSLTLAEYEVLEWILKNFYFYHGKLVEAHVQGVIDQGPSGWDGASFDCVVEGFWEMLKDYDAPFVTETDDDSAYSRSDHCQTHLSADHRAAPAGIKLEDFKTCYASERRGVTAQDDEKEEDEDKHQSTNWPVATTHEDHLFEVDMPSLLQLLLTCRQVNKEATPTFYAINDFYVKGIYDFHGISTRLSAVRFANLQSLFLHLGNWYGDDLSDDDCEHWVSVTESLASRAKPLKLLILKMRDRDWMDLKSRCRSKMTNQKWVKPFDGIETIPGFKNLAIAAFNAERFVLKHASRDCDHIRSFLDERIAMLKSGEVEPVLEKRPIQRAKKSTATAVEDATPSLGKQPTKKAKKPKKA